MTTTIKNIRKAHGTGYDYIVVDANEWYWEDNYGTLVAVGGCGWTASEAEAEACGIKEVVVDHEDKLVYIYINGVL